MGTLGSSLGLTLLIILVISNQAHAFGAGNIASLSRIEGQNWRHGDIEDTLLTLFLARAAGGQKFGKLDVKRVYFGNWLRDYSQAVDVGTVKYVSAEAIRILIWVLGFMSFGYGTGEFEVTTERLGCYQPTEHIDNPLGYAEGEDARNYDHRLRGPVDEERELSIDPRTGLKCYIASEDMEIDTSASLIRRVLGRSIQLGRRYARSGHADDLYEALRLLGTGLHCLEDYAAHSNYTELSLIELGERDVFPHVGSSTTLEISGVQESVYPIVTGTFGGVDFFHSVLGEFSDKATQSEMQSLEGVITESENDSSSESILQGLLSKIPAGLLGDSDAQTSQMDDFKTKADDAKQNASHVTPREPEEWARYLDDVQRQIYPVLEWHDRLLKAINETIEQIPILPDLIEQIQDEITVFVFSILAPYVLPIIQQVKSELETGSSEVIQSSQQQQHIVFNDDSSSNPTHSMLSKDHFSNVLNEPAGRIASSVVKWTVPQLMHCWDDEEEDIDRVLTRIISGVFHHPAQREYGDDDSSEMRRIMFSTVEDWWNEKSDEARDYLREQLSRDGVLEGKNHKEGVQDCGHGCGKPLALPKNHRNAGDAGSDDGGLQRLASEALGGGALGGLVGGLVGGMGSMVLNQNEPHGANDDRNPQSRDDDSQDSDDDTEHSHGHRRRHRNDHHDRHRPDPERNESYGEDPTEPSPYNDSSRPAYPSYPPNPSSFQGFQRGGYNVTYQQEGGQGYYHQERREFYESTETGYVQEQSHYYESSQSIPPPMNQGQYGGELSGQQYPPSFPPPRGNFDEFQRPMYPPMGEIGRDFEGRTAGYEEQHHRHERRSSESSGSRGDEDDENRHRRHHRHHRHHHHHHHEDDRDGSGSDD